MYICQGGRPPFFALERVLGQESTFYSENWVHDWVPDSEDSEPEDNPMDDDEE